MSAGRTAERLMTLVPWLLERQGATLQEAADAVGSTPQEVRDELEALWYCGGPGLGGGSNFELSFHGDRVTVDWAPGLTAPFAPTTAEALQLVMTLTSAQQVLGDRVPALDSALDKIRAAAGLRAQVVGSESSQSTWLEQLSQAIEQGRVVSFGYRARDGVGEQRRLDPWRLERTTNGWYLHGHDRARDAHRVFRLDRITDLTVTGDRVSTNVPDSLPPPQWHPTGPVQRIVVSLGAGAHWLGDQVAADRDEAIGDRRRIEFDTDSLEWTARLLAAGGDQVEVLEPAGLREALAGRAAAALTVHERLRTA